MFRDGTWDLPGEAEGTGWTKVCRAWDCKNRKCPRCVRLLSAAHVVSGWWPDGPSVSGRGPGVGGIRGRGAVVEGGAGPRHPHGLTLDPAPGQQRLVTGHQTSDAERWLCSGWSRPRLEDGADTGHCAVGCGHQGLPHAQRKCHARQYPRSNFSWSWLFVFIFLLIQMEMLFISSMNVLTSSFTTFKINPAASLCRMEAGLFMKSQTTWSNIFFSILYY